MFKNLLNFAYRRNIKEAIGFYFAYLIFFFLLSLITTVLAVMLMGAAAEDGEAGPKIGEFVGGSVAILSSLILSFWILFKKHRLRNFGFLLLALLSGILGTFGGGILGLLPTSFLTTREPASEG